MNKKITTLLIIIFMFNAPLAQGVTTTFIIGAQAGYASGQVNTTSNYFALNTNRESQHVNLGVHGPLAGLFLGCDFSATKVIILGLETNVTLSNIQGKDRRTTTTNVETDHIEQKLKYACDLLLKVGYRYHALLGYIKTGGVLGRWRFESVFASTQNPKPIDFSKNKIVPGVKVALGVEGEISQYVSWGAEYNHTFFKSYTIHRPDENGEDIPYKSSPNYGSFLLRIMCKI